MSRSWSCTRSSGRRPRRMHATLGDGDSVRTQAIAVERDRIVAKVGDAQAHAAVGREVRREGAHEAAKTVVRGVVSEDAAKVGAQERGKVVVVARDVDDAKPERVHFVDLLGRERAVGA